MQTYLPACKIVTTHGVRGEMKALPLCDGAAFLSKFKRLYKTAEGSGETPLLGVRAQGNMLLVRLGGIEDMDAARAQVGHTWYFAKADARLPEGRYFIDDLLGCRGSGCRNRRCVWRDHRGGAPRLPTMCIL